MQELTKTECGGDNNNSGELLKKLCLNCCATCEASPDSTLTSEYSSANPFRHDIFYPIVEISDREEKVGEGVPNKAVIVTSCGEDHEIQKVLHTIFKCGREEDWDQDLSLCSQCCEVLADMYELYVKFEKLQSAESYLSKKLGAFYGQLIESGWDQDQGQGGLEASVGDDNDYTAISDCGFEEDSSSTPPSPSSDGIDIRSMRTVWSVSTADPNLHPAYKGPWVALPKVKHPSQGILPSSSGSRPNDLEDDETDWTPGRRKRKKILKIELFPGANENVAKNRKRTAKKEGKDLNTKYRRRRAKFPNPCWYCTQTFETSADCLAHTRETHFREGSFLCDNCARYCPTQHALTRHKENCVEMFIPGQKFTAHQCPICSKNYDRKRYLNFHIKSHTTPAAVLCPHPSCKFATKTELLLKHHLKRKHSTRTESHPCDQCPQVFGSKVYLQKHQVRMHTAEGNRIYKERLLDMYDKAKEKRRIQRATPKSYVCKECNIDCFTVLMLTTHRKRFHEVEKKFVCEQCGTTFTKKTSLHRHVKYAHSEARPFICEHCGKNFKTVSNLKDHVNRTHSEEGRLKYNAKMRVHHQRRKMVAQALSQAPNQRAPGNHHHFTQPQTVEDFIGNSHHQSLQYMNVGDGVEFGNFD